jgi:WD40 repeat protein/transcriptional regulator with XRE-family HTH domain
VHDGVEGRSLQNVHTKDDFARALAAARKNAGLSVRDLARKVGVPSATVSGWCAGRHLPNITQRDSFLQLLIVCGVAEEDHSEWLACWQRLLQLLGQRRADMPAPYRGLESFQIEHAEWFFGRTRLTGALVDKATSASGIIVAIGPSGSGKSSLLRAGLLATLCERDRWQAVLLTPGEHPMAALDTQLGLAGDPDQHQRLVVVDQFEELFTACTDGAEQAAFLDALHELAGRESVRVVAGMRADFYSEALRWPVLVSAVQDNQVVVGPMTEDELRSAIVEPARLAGMQIENGLVDVLLRDVLPATAHRGLGDAGALPLLSHALLATWEKGRRRTMSIDDYAATGGIHGAIAQTAEAAFSGLSGVEQVLARQLFLRLVHVGDNTPDTRRRVRLDELVGGLTGDELARTKRVLDRYVDHRLVTADSDGVEISHEALLDAWPRLRDWIDTDRAGHRLHRQLTEAARGWDEAGRDPGALYRGVRLDAVVDWVTRENHHGDLNHLEQNFVDASVQASRAERLRQRRQTRRLRALAGALGVLLLVSAATTVYSVQQQEQAERERAVAVSRQVAGTANRVKDSDPALAAQLAVAAYRIAPTVEATSSLLGMSGTPAVGRMIRPGGGRQAVAVNRTGTLLAAAGAEEDDADVVLWDLRAPRRPSILPTRLTGHTGAIYAVDFSPDGKTLATGSADKTVRLWDVSDFARPTLIGAPLTGPQDRILAATFSPDGAFLGVGSRDRTLRLWDVRDREHPVTGPEFTKAGGAVQSITFTPAGTTMAIADAAGAVIIYDTGDPLRPKPLGPPLALPSRVNTVAFSPDGHTLAAGSNDSTVRLWTLTDPAHPVPSHTLTGTGWINAITFSIDGKYMAVASSAARVQVWDLTHKRLHLDLPHASPMTAVAFRDHILYSSGTDGVARSWLLPGPVLPAKDRALTGLSTDPTGTLLADIGKDAQLWDISDHDRPAAAGQLITAPPDADRTTGAVALHPDGRTLAMGIRSGNFLILWDITDREHPRQYPVRLTGHTALIQSAAFSHQGRMLVSTSDDGTARLWDTTDLQHPAPIATLDPRVGYVYAATFTRDGHTLVAITQNGYIAFWDVRDPRHPVALGKPIKAAPDDVRSLAIHPDDRTLAIGIANGTVQMWDITNPAAPVAPQHAIEGPDGIVHSLAFNPDGSVLAGGDGAGQTWMWRVSGGDLTPIAILQAAKTAVWSVQFAQQGGKVAAAVGDIHLWDTNPDRVIHRICDNAGNGITEAEWAKNIPDTPYQPVCP